MAATIQPQQLTGPQTVMLYTGLALTLMAFSAALFAPTEEQSERGFRLLKWLEPRDTDSDM
ncbi:hypothetical protein ACLQ2J_36520 [Streptomyces cyaneofuscatus]|uniref:hypothetical protein n=1 Tax=Streptomyces cyaneofuscatus TaxID=66883 RepID=UPI003CEB80C0